MNRVKIYQIIEYLKRVDFYHDPHDLEEMGVASILCEYGIHNAFTEPELQILFDVLHLCSRSKTNFEKRSGWQTTVNLSLD